MSRVSAEISSTVNPRSSLSTTSAASDASRIKRATSQRQGGPRINRNLLVFCAADSNRVEELRESARLLSWKSIVKDRDELQLTPNQEKQAISKFEEAGKTVDQRIGEAFVFVLTPRQKPGSGDVEWEATPARAAGSLPERVAAKLESVEELISAYAGVRVRMDLDRAEARLWEDDNTIKVQKLWSFYAQYLYLPRLASFAVLANAIDAAVSEIDWGDKFAYAEAMDPEGRPTRPLVGQRVNVQRSGLLVHPELAQEALDIPIPEPKPGPEAGGVTKATMKTRFYGVTKLDPVRAVRDLGSIIAEVTEHLGSSPGGSVSFTLEVNATSEGYDEKIQRTVSENARALGFEDAEFES